MTISVVIPTRNRGAGPRATLESVLAHAGDDVEVLLVDQSTNDETERAIGALRADPRLRYMRTNTVGAGWARHIGVQEAHGDIVAMTDDDCLVSAGWLDTFIELFGKYAQVGLIFSTVRPLEEHRSDGFTPAYLIKRERMIRTAGGGWRGVGLGASMALRRDAVLEIGNFDVLTGPGSPFQSGDDLDIALRLLHKKWWVLETARTAVVHNGFRDMSDYRRLSERDWFSAGGVLAKHIKCRHWSVLPLTFYMVFVLALFRPLSNLLRLQPPRGLKRSVHFGRGWVAGLRRPVVRDQLLFRR